MHGSVNGWCMSAVWVVMWGGGCSVVNCLNKGIFTFPTLSTQLFTFSTKILEAVSLALEVTEQSKFCMESIFNCSAHFV